MSQTSIIAGSLLLAYFVFVTVRGELPCYLQVLGVSTGANCPQGNVSSTGICSGSVGVGVSVGTPISTGGIGVGIGGIGGGLGSYGCYYDICPDGSCSDAYGNCDTDGL